jgi:hypothetical protein
LKIEVDKGDPFGTAVLTSMRALQAVAIPAAKDCPSCDLLSPTRNQCSENPFVSYRPKETVGPLRCMVTGGISGPPTRGDRRCRSFKTLAMPASRRRIAADRFAISEATILSRRAMTVAMTRAGEELADDWIRTSCSIAASCSIALRSGVGDAGARGSCAHALACAAASAELRRRGASRDRRSLSGTDPKDNWEA